MSEGNSRTNGISDRKSNSQSQLRRPPSGHNLSSHNSANGFCSSSLLTTASHQGQKSTASQDQAGKASTDVGNGHGAGAQINAGELSDIIERTLLVVEQSLSKTGGFKTEEVSGRVRKVQ
jgi:hypothetical protein